MPKAKGTYAGEIIERILVVGGAPLTLLSAGAVLWMLNIPDLVSATTNAINQAAQGNLTVNATPVYAIIGAVVAGVLGFAAGALMSKRSSSGDSGS